MKKTFFILCAAAAALVGCNKAEVAAPVANSGSRQISFVASNIYSFDTKTAIANDGQVAIFAGTPIASTISADAINSSVGTYTVSGYSESEGKGTGNLIGGGLLWGIGQGATNANFFAIFPAAKKPTFTYSNPDPANENGYTATFTITNAGDQFEIEKDILIATASQHPGTGETPNSVSLSFQRPFALLEYNFTNSSDDVIKSVQLYGVCMTGTINFTSNAIESNNTTIAEGGKYWMHNTSGSGAAGGAVTTYQGIIMPATTGHEVNPTIDVEMYSGIHYTYALSAAATFDAGKKYSVNINLTGGHNTVSNNRTATFTGFSVSANWTDGGEKDENTASQTGETKWWYVEGTLNNKNWVDHVPMKCIGDNLWEASGLDISCSTAGALSIKLRNVSNPQTDGWNNGVEGEGHIDYGWGLNGSGSIASDFEYASDNTNEAWLLYSPGSENIGITNKGIYTIRFNSSTHRIYYAKKTGNSAY